MVKLYLLTEDSFEISDEDKRVKNFALERKFYEDNIAEKSGEDLYKYLEESIKNFFDFTDCDETLKHEEVLAELERFIIENSSSDDGIKPNQKFCLALIKYCYVLGHHPNGDKLKAEDGEDYLNNRAKLLNRLKLKACIGGEIAEIERDIINTVETKSLYPLLQNSLQKKYLPEVSENNQPHLVSLVGRLNGVDSDDNFSAIADFSIPTMGEMVTDLALYDHNLVIDEIADIVIETKKLAGALANGNKEKGADEESVEFARELNGDTRNIVKALSLITSTYDDEEEVYLDYKDILEEKKSEIKERITKYLTSLSIIEEKEVDEEDYKLLKLALAFSAKNLDIPRWLEEKISPKEDELLKLIRNKSVQKVFTSRKKQTPPTNLKECFDRGSSLSEIEKYLDYETSFNELNLSTLAFHPEAEKILDKLPLDKLTADQVDQMVDKALNLGDIELIEILTRKIENSKLSDALKSKIVLTVTTSSINSFKNFIKCINLLNDKNLKHDILRSPCDGNNNILMTSAYVLRKNPEIFQAVLEEFESLDQNQRSDLLQHRNDIEWSCFMIIAHYHPEKFIYLLEKPELLGGEDERNKFLNQKGSDGWNSLMIMAWYYPEKFLYLLENPELLGGEDKRNELLDQKSNEGLNCLMIMARHHPEKFISLLENPELLGGEDKRNELLNQKGNKGWNCLIIMAWYYPEKLISLLENPELLGGEDKRNELLEQKNNIKQSCLMIMAQHHPEKFLYILENPELLGGEDKRNELLEQKNNNGWNSLGIMAQYHPEKFISLLEKPEILGGEDKRNELLQQKNNDGWSCLMIMAQYHPEKFIYLLEKPELLGGEDKRNELLQQKDDSEWSCLMIMAYYHPEKLISLLEKPELLGKEKERNEILRQTYEQKLKIEESPHSRESRNKLRREALEKIKEILSSNKRGANEAKESQSKRIAAQDNRGTKRQNPSAKESDNPSESPSKAQASRSEEELRRS